MEAFIVAFVMAALFGTVVLVADQIRRLFAHVTINRTIRQAMEKDPSCIPLLVEKLESRQPVPIGLIGWVVVVFGLVMALLVGVGQDQAAGREAWAVTGGTLVIGLAIIGFDWWNRRRTAGMVGAEPQSPE